MGAGPTGAGNRPEPENITSEEIEMENETQANPAPSGGGLLVARAKVTAARARMSTPSDTTAGKSDGND